MRKLVIGEFLSLDGVMEAPEKWTFPYFNEEVGAHLGSSMATSDALLLGRVTYEAFASTFSPQTGGEADTMNHLQKYVVSTTLKTADWNHSTLLQGNIAEAITALKQQPGKNIVVSGSGRLVQSLMQFGLVDEYSLLVYPIILGAGRRLFSDGLNTSSLRLIEARPFSNGVVLLRYQPER
ncbi:dihydrofolate reductase family protein [Ktedonobacter racemifer]|uniref:Bifunctional deaminase-reductase domain protein n=1 Tax=Ktedonobacter racemifer DSM 44963 TaxID=485913 RepID=D6U3E5_KTERA|nr:dihydrofolate reductase family protein [Ktedonobacter racemifer]EFH81149.1 bifunctional deaminase-reductase domain protein [Ktedonobacter racemifer DSM 44963]